MHFSKLHLSIYQMSLPQVGTGSEIATQNEDLAIKLMLPLLDTTQMCHVKNSTRTPTYPCCFLVSVAPGLFMNLLFATNER